MRAPKAVVAVLGDGEPLSAPSPARGRRRAAAVVVAILGAAAVIGVGYAATTRETGPRIDAADCTKDELFGCPDPSTTTAVPLPPVTASSTVVEPSTVPPLTTAPRRPTTTTTARPGEDASVLDMLGKSTSSPEVDRLIATHGCRVPRQLYVPGNPYIATGGGYQCLSSGITISITTGLNVGGIGFYDEGVDGFSRYTGALPFGLHWGDDRRALEARFDQLLGPPVIRLAPTGYSWDTDPKYTDHYAVDGRDPMQSLELEFSADTERLRSVQIGTSKPWCIDSCYHPDEPTTDTTVPTNDDPAPSDG